jgi:hypothetical protein
MVYKTPYKIVNAIVYLRCRFIDGIRVWLPKISEFLSPVEKIKWLDKEITSGDGQVGPLRTKGVTGPEVGFIFVYSDEMARFDFGPDHPFWWAV